MPRNGSGTYARPHDWTADADAGIDIRADRMDEDSDDIAQALSESIARDGQTAITANIPFAGFKATGLGLASALGDALSYGRAATTARLIVNGTGVNSAFEVNNASTDAMFYSGVSSLAVQATENAAAAMFFARRDAGTGRSINAGGTVNASGADYAEYEVKAEGCGTIEKGQIVGFDADGNLTDKWDDAISFGIKSTDPSYVGGDTWGTREAIEAIRGDRPFKEAHEEVRQRMDRVAYSGKVPVNVLGATPGQYIMAVQDGEGIAGVATDATGSNVVGRVRKILPDGRALVSVIVS